jgi:hypothetical protein
MQAAHMGVKWIVGDGNKIRFWEDHWVGNTNLAIMYWPLYVICERQGKTINEVWDGENLKLTFRRNVSSSTMDLWWHLCGLMEDVCLSEEEDQIMWHFTSSGKYAVSLYML